MKGNIIPQAVTRGLVSMKIHTLIIALSVHHLFHKLSTDSIITTNGYHPRRKGRGHREMRGGSGVIFRVIVWMAFPHPRGYH